MSIVGIRLLKDVTAVNGVPSGDEDTALETPQSWGERHQVLMVKGVADAVSGAWTAQFRVWGRNANIFELADAVQKNTPVAWGWQPLTALYLLSGSDDVEERGTFNIHPVANRFEELYVQLTAITGTNTTISAVLAEG